MRYLTYCASAFLLLTVFLFTPAGQADASEPADFVSWALEQGKSCDKTWNRFTSSATVQTYGRGIPLRSMPNGRVSRGAHITSARQTRTAQRSSVSFKGRTASTYYLQRSTRTRGSATRDGGFLHSISKLRKSFSHGRMRPINTRISRADDFTRRTSFSRRNRFNSFGRRSASSRRGGHQRPAPRTDRPRRR